MKRVFVNGTFDLLHPGHIALLSWARQQGDTLTVAIDSDRRVRELKGPTRPIYDQGCRRYILQHLRMVDQVEIFDTDEELINLIAMNDIMVKGADWRGKPIVGEDRAKHILFFERINGYSTTNTIQHIADR